MCLIDIPGITTKTTTVIVTTGKRLKLECSFYPKVWLKNGDPLPDHVEVVTKELFIWVATEEDSGTYQCLEDVPFPTQTRKQDNFVVLVGGNLTSY